MDHGCCHKLPESEKVYNWAHIGKMTSGRHRGYWYDSFIVGPIILHAFRGIARVEGRGYIRLGENDYSLTIRLTIVRVNVMSLLPYK